MMEKWSPIENLPLRVYLDDFHDSVETLKIQVVSESSDNVLIIDFEQYFAYQNTDELYALKKLELNPELTIDWSFFLSNKSEYIDNIVEGSYGMLESISVLHFVITCGNNVIEVLTSKEPYVYWQKPSIDM